MSQPDDIHDPLSWALELRGYPRTCEPWSSPQASATGCADLAALTEHRGLVHWPHLFYLGVIRAWLPAVLRVLIKHHPHAICRLTLTEIARKAEQNSEDELHRDIPRNILWVRRATDHRRASVEQRLIDAVDQGMAPLVDVPHHIDRSIIAPTYEERHRALCAVVKVTVSFIQTVAYTMAESGLLRATVDDLLCLAVAILVDSHRNLNPWTTAPERVKVRT